MSQSLGLARFAALRKQVLGLWRSKYTTESKVEDQVQFLARTCVTSDTEARRHGDCLLHRRGAMRSMVADVDSFKRVRHPHRRISAGSLKSASARITS